MNTRHVPSTESPTTIRRLRIGYACAVSACFLAACSQDYRSSAPDPVPNQALTAWLSKAIVSPQVVRIDCYVDTGWATDALTCDVAMSSDRSGPEASAFQVRSYLTPKALSTGPEWQFDIDALSDSKFRLVVEQPAPAVLKARVHVDQSRVSLEDAEHLADKAVAAVDDYLRSHPTSDPQSLRDTWATHGDPDHRDAGTRAGAASDSSNAGGKQ